MTVDMWHVIRWHFCVQLKSDFILISSLFDSSTASLRVFKTIPTIMPLPLHYLVKWRQILNVSTSNCLWTATFYILRKTVQENREGSRDQGNRDDCRGAWHVHMYSQSLFLYDPQQKWQNLPFLSHSILFGAAAVFSFLGIVRTTVATSRCCFIVGPPAPLSRAHILLLWHNMSYWGSFKYRPPFTLSSHCYSRLLCTPHSSPQRTFGVLPPSTCISFIILLSRLPGHRVSCMLTALYTCTGFDVCALERAPEPHLFVCPPFLISAQSPDRTLGVMVLSGWTFSKRLWSHLLSALCVNKYKDFVHLDRLNMLLCYPSFGLCCIHLEFGVICSVDLIRPMLLTSGFLTPCLRVLTG